MLLKSEAKLLADGYKPKGDLLIKMDGSMCVGVYHIGKYPQIFHSCHYKNGHSWNIRYRAVTLKIPNPISFLEFRLGDLFSEVRYAVKSFFAVKSGFVQMENKYHDGDEWYWEKAEPNGYCARFGNGRHIPLPILANWDEDCNKLQKLAIRLAGGAKEAVEEALQYDIPE